MILSFPRALLSVSAAEKIISSQKFPVRIITCPLHLAFGQVLCENLYADRDDPPCAMARMDGIAIAYRAWNQGRRKFIVQATQRAGRPAQTLRNLSCCFEVMTGAAVPRGCDTVIPYEDLRLSKRMAYFLPKNALRRGQYVRPRAQNYHKGQLLLGKGSVLSAAHIGVLASVGKRRISVAQAPSIAVIGTGDELVGAKSKAQPYQFRQSNTYAVRALLQRQGAKNVRTWHLPDKRATIRRLLQRVIRKYEIILISGGVSKGKFDFIPKALDDLGVKTLFHRVRQRPGKPLLFARKGKTVIFGLPGNPVSTLISCYRYVLPYLKQRVGLRAPARPVYAHLGQAFEPDAPLTYFLPVNVRSQKNGTFRANFIRYTGSGDFNALAHADGFVELPRARIFPKGSRVRFFTF